MEVTNCFSCFEKSNTNYICNEAGVYQVDPWTTHCCSSGDSNAACNPAKTDNVCSSSIADGGYNGYSHCPLINTTKCGDVDRYSGYKQQNMSSKNLTYTDGQYDTCYYRVMNEPYTYKSGKLFLKVSRMNGVKIYVNGGSDIRNASEVVVKNNASAVLEEWYEIDQSSNFNIVVVPIKGETTDWKFYYYTRGVKQPFWEKFYQENFAGEDNEVKLYGAATLIVLVVLLFMCCICICFVMCVKGCVRKCRGSSVPIGKDEKVNGNYTHHRTGTHSGDVEMVSDDVANQHSNHELKLESMVDMDYDTKQANNEDVTHDTGTP
jgi:hypothetical protein